MEIILIWIYGLLGLLTCGSLVMCIISKSKAVSASDRIGRRDMYNITVRSVRTLKLPKTLLIFIIILSSLSGALLLFGVLIALLGLLAMIFTLGGAMFVDTGTGSSGFYNFLDFIADYWRTFLYWGFLVYINLNLIFARKIYVNIICRNRLLQMQQFTKVEPVIPGLISPPEVKELTSQQRKKRIIITCAIIAAAIFYLFVKYVFDFDIIGEILLELP